MSESEKKDKILSFLNLPENRIGFFQMTDLSMLVFKENPLNYQEMKYLIQCMVADDYIIDNDPMYSYKFTITDFLANGGYTRKENQIKTEAEEKRRREDRSDQKTDYELKLVKWQVWVFWFAFGFTVIGSILGMISFFMQLGK